MSEVPAVINPGDDDEASTRSSETDINLYDLWSPSKGRYRPGRTEYQAKRIELIDTANNLGVRVIEYTMYAYELSGQVRTRWQVAKEVVEENINEKKRQKLLEQERVAQLVQIQVETVYQRYVSGYGYSELSRLKELTKEHTPENTAPLLAIERLYNRSLIGPLHRRTTEGIVRAMIAEEKGLAEQLPQPQTSLEAVK